MKNSSLGLSLLIGLGAIFMTACGSDGGSGGNACPAGEVSCDGVCIDEIEPTLTSIQTDVFEVSCTASSCHDSQAPAQNLDLSSLEASEANLIAVDSEQVEGKLVLPGDSDASYLMNKLLGEDLAFGTARMPQLDADGLCTPKIDAVNTWIEAGAPIQ